jgi:hypothetical protein
MSTAPAAAVHSAQELVQEVLFLDKRLMCSMEMFKDISDDCLKKDRKTKAPFTDKIEVRHVFKNIGIGCDYQTIVNNKLRAAGLEPTFEAKPLQWGHFLPGSRTVLEHTKAGETESQLYIRFWLHNNTETTSTYYLNGAEIDKALLPDVLPKDYGYQSSARQEEVGLDTLEEQAKPFSPAMRNIVQVKVNGKTFMPFA